MRVNKVTGVCSGTPAGGHLVREGVEWSGQIVEDKQRWIFNYTFTLFAVAIAELVI